MKILNYFLTEFEQEILKEMDKPEKWNRNEYTIDHCLGFHFWTSNLPFFDFNGYSNVFDKVKTPKISGWIAKFLLWAKYQFVLNPVLANQALKNDHDYAMAVLKSEDKNNA